MQFIRCVSFLGAGIAGFSIGSYIYRITCRTINDIMLKYECDKCDKNYNEINVKCKCISVPQYIKNLRNVGWNRQTHRMARICIGDHLFSVVIFVCPFISVYMCYYYPSIGFIKISILSAIITYMIDMLLFNAINLIFKFS